MGCRKLVVCGEPNDNDAHADGNVFPENSREFFKVFLATRVQVELFDDPKYQTQISIKKSWEMESPTRCQRIHWGLCHKGKLPVYPGSRWIEYNMRHMRTFFFYGMVCCIFSQLLKTKEAFLLPLPMWHGSVWNKCTTYQQAPGKASDKENPICLRETVMQSFSWEADKRLKRSIRAFKSLMDTILPFDDPKYQIGE